MVLKGVTVGAATMAHCVVSEGLELASPNIKVHEVLELVVVTFFMQLIASKGAGLSPIVLRLLI